MGHRLHVIHASHPCVAAERALQLTRQPYRVVEYPPVLHVAAMQLRFGHPTVPLLVLGNGERVAGSRAIVRRLDELVPQAGLLPADAVARERVLAAERWGDEELQPAVRRLFWLGIKQSPRAIDGYAAGSRLPLPRPLRTLVTPVVCRLAAWRNRADETSRRADLAALPGWLDDVDQLIADGVIGGPQPNAADLQIGSSLRMLATFADAWPLLAGRPAWQLARQVCPVYPGEGGLPPGSLTTSGGPASRTSSLSPAGNPSSA
ncbi:glutathione S-transferase family protein [Conexibacter sp. CPCC 206217]|uniref:glutathione S-transferase family protein n=1 Tax=Conexibacter sp. CPCC 206217 TaxID=3064574 RepID=UPI002722FD1C|nr:glutathione S-transferase family protein [Conexibacter sp. CPCC 206217]MDO8209358.1 glutathione S-transferase family protein [Conexibacter sp. CPCC 206217]